jgi:hypothetical protein
MSVGAVEQRSAPCGGQSLSAWGYVVVFVDDVVMSRRSTAASEGTGTGAIGPESLLQLARPSEPMATRQP